MNYKEKFLSFQIASAFTEIYRETDTPENEWEKALFLDISANADDYYEGRIQELSEELKFCSDKDAEKISERIDELKKELKQVRRTLTMYKKQL